jgi:anti-sigma-K factor RskA
MTERDDAHLLSGAYAVGAVNAEEAAAVEAAMRDSEELRSEVTGLSDTAVALGLALTPQTPPPALRARLLDAIETTPQDAPVGHPLESTAESTPPAAMPTGNHTAPRRRRRRRPMAVLALVAAAVALFGGGFFVQRTILEPQSEYTSVVAASDVQKATAHVSGGGVATVSWSKSQHRTAVSLTGVRAPSGRVLQMWSIRSGTPTSAGLYDPRDGQNYTVISGTPSAGEFLAVTVEPDGGSPVPTTTPIVAVKLSA